MARRGPRRLSSWPGATPRLPSTTLLFAAALLLLPLAALGFMLPLRQRLREPNDVHHSFRETTPAMRQGPNLLSVGPLPAAPPAGDSGAVLDMPPGLAELQQQQEEEEMSLPYTSTTFEEDLFMIDKGADLATLLEPLKKEQLAFNDAPPSFIPLTDLFDQGMAATKEAVAAVAAEAKKFDADEAAAVAAAAVAQAPRVVASVLVRQGKAAGAALGRVVNKVQQVATRYVSENTQFFQRVIAHLMAEARASLTRMHVRMTTHLEGLISQLEASLLTSGKARAHKIQERVMKKYDQVQAATTEERAMLQALLRPRVAAVKSRWSVVKSKAHEFYSTLKGVAGTKMEQVQQFLSSFSGKGAAAAAAAATTKEEMMKFDQYGRVVTKAQAAVRRTLLKGRQLASRVKARQVEHWAVGGRQERKEGGKEGRLKSVGDLVSDFGTRIMKAEEALALPSSLPSSSSSSSELSSVPAFSMIYVSGGSDLGGGLRLLKEKKQAGEGGEEEEVLLVPSFDDEPWQRDEEEVEVREGGREEGQEEMLEGGMVGDELEAPLMAADATTMMVVEENSVGSSSSSRSSNLNVDENEDEEEDGDDDDFHDGLGLTTPAQAQVESEDDYLQEEKDLDSSSLSSSSSSTTTTTTTNLLIRFGGQAISESEHARMEKLRQRLIMLPDSLTHWVSSGDLIRFTRAHDHVENAWAALKHTCYFRREQQVDLLLSNEEKEGKFAGSALEKELFWFGLDKEGDPMLVFRTALHQPGRYTTEAYLEYILFLIEKGKREYGLGERTQVSFLVDRMGGGLRNQDPRVVFALVPLVQAHFPEMLKRTYVAPVSGVFGFIWKVFTLVLAKETAGRVQLLGKAEVEGGREGGGVLGKVFFEGHLMRYLGGSLEGYEKAEGGREGGRGEGNGSMSSVLSSA